MSSGGIDICAEAVHLALNIWVPSLASAYSSLNLVESLLLSLDRFLGFRNFVVELTVLKCSVKYCDNDSRRDDRREDDREDKLP